VTDQRRQHLETAPRCCTFDAGQVAKLAREARLVAVNRGPGGALTAGARSIAPKRRPPLLHLPMRKTETAERYGDFRLPALRRQLSPGIKDDIEGQLLLAVTEHFQVALQPVRVDEELVRPGGITIGIEDNPDIVVGEDLVAIAHRHAHRRRIVVADEGEIETLGIISYQHLGRHRRSHLIAGRVLGKVICFGGADPAGIIELPVNLDRAGGTPDLQSWFLIVYEWRLRDGWGGTAEYEQ